MRCLNLDTLGLLLLSGYAMGMAQSRLKLFQNHWLEKLTVISAPVFIVLWSVGLPFIAWQAWTTADAASLTLLLLLPTGVLVWTLTEYAMHRFFFHWEPASALLGQLVFVMHGNHHAVPNDRLRNLMPPIVSLPLGGAIWAIMLALIGPAGSWLFLGFMMGYVTYDLVHFACHQWPMKGRFARMLKTHHMRHHHLHETGNFAITGMLWDRMFRTRLVPSSPRR